MPIDRVPNASGGLDYKGGDWSGADFPLLTSKDTLSGIHFNVDRFVVPSGVIVKVRPFASGDTTSGFVEMRCRTALILGTIDATGAGYGGGGGGAGGSGGSDGNGNAGGGAAGAAGPDATPGSSAGARGSGAHGQGGQAGGSGGLGGGPGGGAPGSPGGVANGPAWVDGAPGSAGGNGGYDTPGLNTDGSTDDSVLIGSGGGGGGGGGGSAVAADHSNAGGGGGGGGGAGARGGGCIKILSNRIFITGAVLSYGSLTGNATVGGGAYKQNSSPGIGYGGGGGGAGGSGVVTGASSGAAGGTGRYWLIGPSRVGGTGGNGGTGSGGGILLEYSGQCPQISAQVNRVIIGGTVISSGGSPTNGGTVKVFYPSLDVSVLPVAGRYYPYKNKVFGSMAG